ncbi:Zinc finger and BTB domain-containing protein 17 [Chionoecetes opilio]|uniref:Zinc finger and BTB domain-containing protein 17 n=1 Tax=Chionoecetes opilio TaxID=41210 RepID=A0A8J4Y465_CHIOP|nr:Zinc finger and BTB domain-containing protein 17 [Chionoecetes opilio]
MATAEVIREAALYLEYFLKGLSECSVIGSYTVQFLEMRGFSPRLQSSLVTHLLQLIANMKSLLAKIDESFESFCNAEIQTDDINDCSLCKCQDSLLTPMKSPGMPNAKVDLESSPQEKAYEPPELVQLLSSPLIQLKQEVTCIPDPDVSSDTPHCQGVEMTISDIDIKDLRTKNTLKLHESNDCPSPHMSKCVLASPLGVAAPLEHMDLDYVTSAHLDQDAPGEILLQDLEGTEVASSDSLMYSVYTMNPSGSLQLVSRVLSKTAMPKEDATEDQTQRTVIKTSDGRESQESCAQVEAMSYEGMQAAGTEASEEEMVVAPDISSFEGTVLVPSAHQLGPEDLGSGTWCTICEKEFPSSGSLKVHLSRAHGQVKWCLTCTKTMNSEEEMCDHVRECHGDLPFVCLVCGQTLRTNAAFQRHMHIHKGLRGSACEICGQTFSRPEYYREHKRIHTGEKPYECETCKKTFSRSSNLYAHMRIHNKEQRHVCEVCTKTFARADKLKDHMIRHLQIKRYACRLCPKAYNEKRDLTKHLEKMHNSQLNVEFVIGS